MKNKEQDAKNIESLRRMHETMDRLEYEIHTNNQREKIANGFAEVAFDHIKFEVSQSKVRVSFWLEQSEMIGVEQYMSVEPGDTLVTYINGKLIIGLEKA